MKTVNKSCQKIPKVVKKIPFSCQNIQKMAKLAKRWQKLPKDGKCCQKFEILKRYQ